MVKETVHLFITHYSAGTRDPMPALLRSLFGGAEVYTEPGSCAYQIAPGIVLQLCNAGVQPPAYLTEAPQPVISWRVEDLDSAVSTALDLGAVVLERQTDACTGFAVCHLKLPDLSVIGFFAV
ncbi:hypothetical protein SNE25_15385 [Mucilaginibacter sabulilitoris]|uniref:VOC domain-containing protein n=1 Tax=Mucilaginibacter sabulilitoris TaxID=1173583 RepID=A0ABZ0TXV0_9SPHI|nr:hypothetical protein [Mucilaginibacter sabulilitoris]WPU96903.1 hypothetical protein SNE25_15385 [Mucilaginibacter sabulilitoris]